MKNALKGLVLAFILVAGASFNSQASASEAVGSAPIYMGDELKKRWDKYDNSFQRAYFLIRLENGRVTNAGHWHCGNSIGGECISETDKNFMWRVRKDNGQDWFLFAKYGKIVWKGPVCYNGQNLNNVGDCQSSYNASPTGTGSETNETISSKSDEAVCRNATTNDGSWENNYRYDDYVREAKRRNLSLNRCLELSGRAKTDHLKEMASKTLCFGATKADGNWEDTQAYQKLVKEAKRRNLTISICSELTGRPIPASSVSQSSSTKATNKNLDSIEVRLKKLKNLEDSGLITSEEAKSKRKEILKDM